MMTIFRLEDEDGNGPFFYKDGTSRTDNDLRFEDEGIFGFTDLSRFQEPSYIGFYNDDSFNLYEVVVSNVISLRNRQAVFLESHIISKRKIDKDKSRVS